MSSSPVLSDPQLPDDYGVLLAEIKARVVAAQARAALAVSAVRLSAYWEIGRGILAREHAEGWGAKVVERLAVDLRREFPEMTGLSVGRLRPRCVPPCPSFPGWPTS